MTVWIASAAVVFPELLAPENRLTGPISNSQFGTLPQLTNTTFLRNMVIPATRRCGVCGVRPIPAIAGTLAVRDTSSHRHISGIRRPARRVDGISADEIDDHRMNPQPRLRGLEFLIAVVIDQPQLSQPLEYLAAFRGLLRQAAIQPILHRQCDRLQGLGGKAVLVDLRLAHGLVVLGAQHQNHGHLILGEPRAQAAAECLVLRLLHARCAAARRIQTRVLKAPIMVHHDPVQRQRLADQFLHAHEAIVQFLLRLRLAALQHPIVDEADQQAAKLLEADARGFQPLLHEVTEQHAAAPRRDEPRTRLRPHRTPSSRAVRSRRLRISSPYPPSPRRRLPTHAPRTAVRARPESAATWCESHARRRASPPGSHTTDDYSLRRRVPMPAPRTGAAAPPDRPPRQPPPGCPPGACGRCSATAGDPGPRSPCRSPPSA